MNEPGNLPQSAQRNEPPRPSTPRGSPLSPGVRPVGPQPSGVAPQPGNIDLKFSESASPAGTPPSMPGIPTKPPLPPAQPKPAASAPQEYKAAIRTMSDDVGKIKTGQQPSGIPMEKSIAPPTPPRPAAPVTPPLPGRPQGPQIQTQLGQAERAKPLAPSPLPSAPLPARPSVPPQKVVVPPLAKPRGRGLIYTLILVLALLAGGLIFILAPGEESSEPTPSTSASESPAPLAQSLRGLLGNPAPQSITLSEAGDPADEFQSQLNALAINGGVVKLLSVSAQEKGAEELSPADLVERFLGIYSPEVAAHLGQDNAILVYGQRESYDSNGNPVPASSIKRKVIFISEVTNDSQIAPALSAWETDVTDDLADSLLLDTGKPASPGFLSNTYQGKSIRYRNFPYPDQSIDYGIITARNGKSYLVIANSRESMYATIDALR